MRYGKPTIVDLREKMVELNATAKAIGDSASPGGLTAARTAEMNTCLDAAALAKVDIGKLESEAVIARQVDLGEELDAPLPRRTGTGARAAMQPRGYGATYATPRDHSAEARHGFVNMGDFALACVGAAPGSTSAPDPRLYVGAAVSGMQQTTGQDGGFLVPPSFSKDIWDGMNATPDNLLAMTDNFTIEGESLSFPANPETSRATGSRYGGVRGYWDAEGVQTTKSSPKLREVKVEPHGMTVLIFATDKLLGNATALEQYLNKAAVDEINFLVGDAIVNGDGAGKPSGFLNSDALVTISKETGQQANTIESENITNMFSRLHARSRAGAVWLINQDIEPQLQAMTIGVGVSGQLVYLQPGGFENRPFGRMYGLDVMPIEYCATLGTVGDIILADMKGYVSGTRGGIDSAMSIHLRFDFNETAFRFRFAVDGQTWLNSPITPFKGTSNTQSNFVVLETRS